LRLRMQQVAQLLVGGLGEVLTARPHAPLHFINIGGGPAMDSLNAVLMLRRAGVLQRPLRIHVLDGDDAGPWFGAQALEALKAPGAPLGELDLEFAHISYDWREPEKLERFAASLGHDAVIAASSEGALFEYGDDAAVIGNLKALRAGGANLVSGSV